MGVPGDQPLMERVLALSLEGGGPLQAAAQQETGVFSIPTVLVPHSR
jgi:hypothetical protein